MWNNHGGAHAHHTDKQYHSYKSCWIMSSHAWWFSVNIHRQSWSYSLLVFCKIWVCLSANPPPINGLCKDENLSFNVRQSSKYKVQMQKHSGMPFQTVDKCRYQSTSQNELLTSQRIGQYSWTICPSFQTMNFLSYQLSWSCLNLPKGLQSRLQALPMPQ